MNKVILFRRELSIEEEIKAASKYFQIAHQRAAINKRELIIPRYSLLPYARELEEDIKLLGGELINSYAEHSYTTDVYNWYQDLKNYTFKTWFGAQEIPYNENGPFVVKGLINSRKHSWNRKMFAEDRSHLGLVIANLLDDPFIAEQGICIRKYEPLQTFILGENELPITNEWRSFWYKGKFIDMAYYWQSHFFDLPIEISRTLQIGSEYYNKMCDFIYPIAQEIKDRIPFVCIDAGFKETGEPILIEINDGCQSGLSCIDPDNFYKRLKEVLDEPMDRN